jgi:hypothetical protein
MSTDRGPRQGGGSVGHASRTHCGGRSVRCATSGHGGLGVPTYLPTRGEGLELAQVVAGDEPVPCGVRAFEAAVRHRAEKHGATAERATADITQRSQRSSYRRARIVPTSRFPTPANRRGRSIDNQAQHDSPLDSSSPKVTNPAQIRYMGLTESSMGKLQAAPPSSWRLIRATTSAGLTRGFTR